MVDDIQIFQGLLFLVSVVKLEKRCEEHQQCIVNNSECINAKCRCKSGYRIENYNCVRSIGIVFYVDKYYIQSSSSMAPWAISEP